jgi:hypothetical protein
LAKVVRRLGGVARIISTASATLMASDSPFIANTAVTHCPSVWAPPAAGLYCRVALPMPARRSVFPHRTLQPLHVHSRFAGDVSSSWPLIWPISTVRVDPQSAQIRGPGGGHALARYRNARSLSWFASLRHPFRQAA